MCEWSQSRGAQLGGEVHSRVHEDVIIRTTNVLHPRELAWRLCLIEHIAWPYSPERFRLIVEGGVHHPRQALLD